MRNRRKLGKCIVDCEGNFTWAEIQKMKEKTNINLSKSTYGNINYRKNIMLSSIKNNKKQDNGLSSSL